MTTSSGFSLDQAFYVVDAYTTLSDTININFNYNYTEIFKNGPLLVAVEAILLHMTAGAGVLPPNGDFMALVASTSQPFSQSSFKENNPSTTLYAWCVQNNLTQEHINIQNESLDRTILMNMNSSLTLKLQQNFTSNLTCQVDKFYVRLRFMRP